jgi:hypothetical protein
MGVALTGQNIRRLLANANEEAKHHGEELAADPDLAPWAAAVASLQEESSPATYLAITGVLLAARGLFPREELDVLDVQTGTSQRGYAAASIGSALSSFAKGQRINLRAASSQPLNNQPFTFEPRITADMRVQPKFQDAFARFYATAGKVQDLTPDQARRVLALMFHLCRRVDAPTITVEVAHGGRSTMDKIGASVAQFVAQNSDNGKVGQSFVAALLDLLYTPDEVVLGDTQDPSRRVPGDVQVGVTQGVWLYTEAKQKVVVTGDVEGFLGQVKDRGGERVVYFALANSSYPENISPASVQRAAERLGVGVTVVDSPQAALDWLLPLCPGSYAALAARLLARAHARMTQSRCSTATLEAFSDLARRYATVS